MPAEAATVAVHATAVAIDGCALLICGPSRSGKSHLAFSLIRASTRHRPIRLIGDDRILLARRDAAVIALPHPRIAGFIERRGLGIVAMNYLAAAPLAAMVELGGSKTLTWRDLQNFPVLSLVKEVEMRIRGDRVLRWWSDSRIAGEIATCGQHSRAKAALRAQTSGKD